jgi:hypothetical protein
MRSETLTSPAQALPRTLTDEEFEIARQELIRQADRHLGYLRLREQMRCGGRTVEPLDVEEKFAALLHFLRPSARYPRNATHISRHFGAEQRRVLYALLDDLEEHVRWNGFGLHQVYEQLRKSPTYPG